MEIPLAIGGFLDFRFVEWDQWSGRKSPTVTNKTYTSY